LSGSLGFLAGGGELGERIRAFDWSRTSIGPAEGWPESLKIAVRIMLASSQPIWIGWGDDLVYLYNDPYKAIIGGKHPRMLGRPTHVVWAEIWDVIAPMLRTALTSEQGTYVESQLLIMERHGYREETYYTFSYSPIPGDDGRPAGIICANTDDTQRVIGERQLDLLRELAAKTAEALTAHDVCEHAAEALATNPYDLPFACLYLAEEDGSGFTLSGAHGIEAGTPSAPAFVPAGTERASRLSAAFGQREILLVDGLQSVAPVELPTGVWDEAPTRGAYVPLGAEGVLVVGLNPFRLYDSGYSDFLGLVGSQISANLATARAYEGERRRAEALAELDRAKTVFFSNISHEFRTPLTLMLGPLEALLQEGDAVGDGARESLEVIRRNALRLLRMVNTVLDFSRIGADQSTHVFQATDLAAATRELADHFRSLMEHAGIGLVVDVEPLPQPVYVDVDAWDKIVLNLLSNAFKFTLEGEVRVTLDAVGERVRLRVADTGTGIPREELPYLFERFHRVRNEEARTHEGTGIGLALVRELVELHGGAVSVESVVGGGTTFTVELPLGAGHLPAEQVSDELRVRREGDTSLAYTEEALRWSAEGVDRSAAGEVGTAGRDSQITCAWARVVVVDDNADMRGYMTRLLERHWRVDAYPDGRAALEAIQADPPELVLTDVMMPRLDGFGLLAALRADARTASIPVIVVSARAGEESAVEGLEAGADDYLVKPFSARELVARVRANLELARLRADAARLAALEEVRSRVIATVSHELRTPVAAIYGATRTLDEVRGLDADTREELQAVIRSESVRLARITQDILTTESLAAGLFAVSPAPLDVRAPVADAVHAARARAMGGVGIRLTLPEAPVVAMADQARLQQVLTNLLDNAIKYSDGDGEVEAGVIESDGEVQIVVVDRGIGIPEAEREEIFHRFYRADPNLTRGVSGSGLGLYISRQLVEAMGGTIVVQANEPKGSRFVVRLPRA
jgi:signal transduction histidine kinase